MTVAEVPWPVERGGSPLPAPRGFALWVETSAAGWAEAPGLADFLRGFGRDLVSRRRLVSASHAITRFVLRTTDAPAARAFYSALVGHDRLPMVPLHEQALARGARPHWLGQIEVDDVVGSVRAFVEQGAEALSPIGASPDGRRFAVRPVRDAGGVVLGPFPLPCGERVAVCGDPQGAGFALRG